VKKLFVKLKLRAMNNCCFKFNGQLFDTSGGGCENYVEVANFAALPVTGDEDTTYKTLDDGKIFEWNGTEYVELSAQTTPIGATLMKTGQTVSYRTGDDGDIEAGREVDFFTLSANNPFGNNKRFTGITGGYQIGGVNYNKDGGTTTAALAFPNDIVIDWSTYNGNNVLGYRRTLLANANWNSQIDACLVLNVGGYTGWFLASIKQGQNLINYELNTINYNPFNITGFFHTSTSFSSTESLYIYGLNGLSTNFAKTGAIQGLPARTFTVTGTTLT
jgi:hypothetical protein